MPLWSPPLLPDADEAQEWARQELARKIYDDQPGLLELLWEKILELLEKIAEAGGGLNYAFVPLIIVGVLAAVMVAAFALGGPIRRPKASAERAGLVWDGDDTRTAQQLRVAAEAAAKGGDYATAIVETFRAITRRLEERAVLGLSVGLTATEVSVQATAPFPEHGSSLRSAAELFNSVLYGGLSASSADYARLRSLDQTLEETKPVHQFASHTQAGIHS